MPSRPDRICGCGRRVPGGFRCECARARDRERGTARDRGYDAAWEKASKAFLAEPANAFCSCGCGRRSRVVDHREPHRGNMQLFWRRSNWQPMCSPCHSRKAQSERGVSWRPAKSQPRADGAFLV